VANIGIVGGGFSALVASASTNFQAKIITPLISNHLNKIFAVDKILSKKSGSLASFKILNKNVRLHERLILGGNSKIWGGFVNMDGLDSRGIALLESMGVQFKPLSFDGTGSLSNKNIYQLQYNDLILDSSNIIRPNTNEMVKSIGWLGSKPYLVLYSGIVLYFDKLILCVGVVQLIQILIASNLIRKGDYISLNEYPCRFNLSFLRALPETNDCVIRYGFFRAINHFVGVQKKTTPEFLPLYLDQIFLSSKNHLAMQYNGAEEFSAHSLGFGGSIHYCNLKINSMPINDFISNLNPNISVLGMASVNQMIPGPISNDIINGALVYDS